MAASADLRSYYDESLKCVRCGLCQAVCPTFAVERREAAVARGKVQLVRALLEGRLAPSTPVRERLFLCLNCGACTANCPSGVAVADLILAARSQLLADLGQPAVERLLLNDVLARPSGLRLAGAALDLYRRSGLRWLAHKAGLLRALPGDLGEAEALLPAPARDGRRPYVVDPPEHPKHRVAYFAGCLTTVLYPDLAGTVVAVLRRQGCEVVMPAGLSCCGMPHRSYGDRAKAEELEGRNAERLNAAGVEAIVTDCATCGAGLKGYGGLRPPVYDLNEFLAEKIALASPERPLPLRVTYHDPCHLGRGQGVREAPRRLLRQIPSLEFVEMAEADRCCGGAGTFALTHYAASTQILERKVANAATTEAAIVATGCPACRMQLNHGLARRAAAGRASPAEALHPVELLARAYRQ